MRSSNLDCSPDVTSPDISNENRGRTEPPTPSRRLRQKEFTLLMHLYQVVLPLLRAAHLPLWWEEMLTRSIKPKAHLAPWVKRLFTQAATAQGKLHSGRNADLVPMIQSCDCHGCFILLCKKEKIKSGPPLSQYL